MRRKSARIVHRTLVRPEASLDSRASVTPENTRRCRREEVRTPCWFGFRSPLTRAHPVAAHYIRHFPPCPHGAPPEPGPLRCARVPALVPRPPRPRRTRRSQARAVFPPPAAAPSRARDPARPRSPRRARGRRRLGERLEAPREAGAAPRRARSSAAARGERVAARDRRRSLAVASRAWRERRAQSTRVFFDARNKRDGRVGF